MPNKLIRADIYKDLCIILPNLNENCVPHGYKIYKISQTKSNFKGVAFKRKGEVVVCFEGTNKWSLKDHAANFATAFRVESAQMEDAEIFLKQF